jgi:hypothetical protein
MSLHPISSIEKLLYVSLWKVICHSGPFRVRTVWFSVIGGTDKVDGQLVTGSNSPEITVTVITIKNQQQPQYSHSCHSNGRDRSSAWNYLSLRNNQKPLGCHVCNEFMRKLSLGLDEFSLPPAFLYSQLVGVGGVEDGSEMILSIHASWSSDTCWVNSTISF